MNALATNEWHEPNQRYLAVALAWLRLRLERHAQREPAAPGPPAVPPAPLAIRRGFLRKTAAAPEAPAFPLLPPPAAISDGQMEQAAAAMAAAEAIEPPPPWSCWDSGWGWRASSAMSCSCAPPWSSIRALRRSAPAPKATRTGPTPPLRSPWRSSTIRRGPRSRRSDRYATGG